MATTRKFSELRARMSAESLARAEEAFNRQKRLRHVEVLPGLCLRLTFMDASVHTVDFQPLLNQSPGLAPLADERAFAQATLLEGEGWTVVWPELDIQIGADTLWVDACAQMQSGS